MSSDHKKYLLAPAVKAEFMSWWHGLTSETASGTARADRAVLKRANTLTEVACTPAYQRIYRKMVDANDGAPWQEYEQDRIAALIGLAAHIKGKGSVPMTLPQAMSHRAKDSDRNPVSDLRFSRLLDAPDIEALFTGLRRSLPLIENKVDPATLADDVFGWGDFVKKRWAYSYKWPEKSGG
jgi:CRISPR system Cascade subunit CasB